MIQLELFPKENKQSIIHGDCLEVMRKMAPNSVDFIVTDPPYGLSFMGQRWDGTVPSIEIWAEALRVCKPGSMLAAFGGSRTHHHLMLAIEGAGWEIRDCIMWLYGSGFPKSHNHFGLEGYGTALKPAYEPVIVAMKPLDGTYKQNVEKWGLGGINIDESRIATTDNCSRENHVEPGFSGGWGVKSSEGNSKGRWPANLIFDEQAAEMLDEQSGTLKSSGASRFFYCAKVSSKERNKGLEGIPKQNNHPTVKPIALMKYIITLLAPPNNPTLLDPFCGSGSTLVAAKELGINAIGIEREKEYCEIAEKRL